MSSEPGSPWTDAQLELIERGDARLLRELAGDLGVLLDPHALRQFKTWGGKLTLRQTLGAISAALSSEHGLGLSEVSDFMYTAVCLVAVAGQRVIVTFGDASTARTTVAQIFEPLRPWYRDLPRNRARVDAWLELSEEPPRRLALALVKRKASASASSDEGVLRAAVCANPEDLATRAVLADLLTQRGDAHGELITLQLEVGERRHDPALEKLRQRIVRLSADHGARIAGEVTMHARNYELRRGFVEAVTMDVSKFNTHGERLLQQHPIIRLTPRPISPVALAKLAKAPALARIRELEIDQEIGARRSVPLLPLAKSPLLTSLRGLRLFHHFAPDWVEAFTALKAPELRGLELSSGDWTLEAVTTLLRNREVPRLERLKLDRFLADLLPEDRRTTVAFIKAIAARASLRELKFEGQLFLRPEDWAAFFDGPAAQGLEQLSIQASRFDDACLGALAGSKSRGLKSFELSGLMVKNGLAAFLKSPVAAKLERLVVYASELSAEELGRVNAVLAALPSSHPLRYVGGFERGARYLDPHA